MILIREIFFVPAAWGGAEAALCRETGVRRGGDNRKDLEF